MSICTVFLVIFSVKRTFPLDRRCSEYAMADLKHHWDIPVKNSMNHNCDS